MGSIFETILNPKICSKCVIFWVIFGCLFDSCFDIFGVLSGSCLLFLEAVLGGSWAQNLNKTYGFFRFLNMVFFGVLEVFDGPFGVILDFLGLFWSQNGFQNGYQKGSNKLSKIGQQKCPKKDQICTSVGFEFGPTIEKKSL